MSDSLSITANCRSSQKKRIRTSIDAPETTTSATESRNGWADASGPSPGTGTAAGEASNASGTISTDLK